MQDMSSSLLDVVLLCKRNLQNNELHHLEPFWRARIYLALNAEYKKKCSSQSGEVNKLSILPAFHIATITTAHVLPLWQELWPDDYLPQQLLALGNEKLQQQRFSTDVRQFLNWSETTLTHMSNSNNESIQKRVCVGFAAKTTAEIAVTRKDDFISAFVNRTDVFCWVESDFDLYSSDASKWAAVAYAGGTWSSTFDVQKSHEFWMWWLDEAVPQTWRQLVNEMSL